MIDNENLIFQEVSKALREAFDVIFITGVEITTSPPNFPAVSIVQEISETNAKYSTFTSVDNVASETYKYDIYSNLIDEREAKEETKAILRIIDKTMSNLFYIRSFNQPLPGADDRYTRRVARYKKSNIT